MRVSFNKNRFRNVAVLSIAVFSFALAVGAAFYCSGFRINLTPSLPVGIWKINEQFTEIKKGDIVWFAPTKAIAQFGIKRNYLVETRGCENNCIPLIKQVYGLPGDTFGFDNDLIRINDHQIENAKRRQTDSQGRPMPKLSDGRVPQDHLFVLTLNSHSFDSRYYGTIPIKNVEGTATPVLTWKN